MNLFVVVDTYVKSNVPFSWFELGLAVPDIAWKCFLVYVLFQLSVALRIYIKNAKK